MASEPHINDRALVEILARRVSAEYALRCVELGDLVGFGWVGLLEARARFDASRGVLFATYAAPCIRGAIINGLRSMGWRSGRALEEERALGVIVAEASRPAPLEPVDDTLGRAEDVRILRAALLGLSMREHAAIVGLHLEERSLDDVGAELGVSRSWACRIAQGARAQLRLAFKEAA